MTRVNRGALIGAFVASVLAQASVLAAPQSASSAQQSASSNDALLEEVIVTGSRIKRDPTTAPTPLIQVSREDVVNSGLASVIDVLADIPALSGSIVPEDTTGSNLNDGGLSLLNLRDLGSGRTLTLVDGKRHVGSAAGSLSVDIDTIPRLLIERVELVTGANSAQYGADAVSGVVNFVLRRDFEGLEIDASNAMINKDGQTNKRISILGGTNLFGDRLNVYGSFEHEENDEVRDADVDWRADAWSFFGRDFDPVSAPNDGIVDNILLKDARTLSIAPGGRLTLVSDIAQDPTRNIPNVRCPAPNLITPISANCIIQEPGLTWVFGDNGAARLANFGTIRNNVGRVRNLNVGGDGLNVNTEFSQFSRLPEASADRFQGGLNFNLTENVQLFGEVKYVKEETFDESQQTFFSVNVMNDPWLAFYGDTQIIASSQFNTGLDNAYLDPVLRTAILNNRRAVFNAAGNPTGETVSDPRANLQIFGPSRTQLNKKELMRYVAGVRGEAESLGFISDISYELSYTYGKLENQNFESAVDAMRFKHSADAVVDTAGRVGRPGDVVCRVKLLIAQGRQIPDQLRGGFYSPTNPEIANCVPSRIFGLNGYSQAARDYFNATIRVLEENQQQDALGFVSGNLWDLWGAGPIGVALGAEYREEKTSGIGRSRDTGDRLLFLNTGPDFLEAKYDTTEFFGELRLPLLKDTFLVKSLEVGAAARSSDYSTVGSTETYNFNLVWRPIDDITLRATRGKSVRIPTLGENFGPPTQTFANGLTDPCSATVINSLTDATVRANRQRNCVAIGIPAGTVITYQSGVPGKIAGNPFLLPETSYTTTASMIVTPRFLPKATLVIDYYDIQIKDVIASISVQTAANQCVSNDTVNAAICSTLVRTGASGAGTIPPYGIADFIQGSVNYAKLYTRGVDYQILYRTDSNLSFSLSGNYLFDWRQYVDISNPSFYSRSEGYTGFPRTRFAFSTDWRVSNNFNLRWKADYQASQYLFNVNTLAGNDDLYENTAFYETGSFIQHDFSAQYAPIENLVLRGGVVNAFDKKPAKWLGGTSADNFDLFGRRYFLGVNYNF
jgi:outer membrane receptor protein involved in Fe transport